MIKSLHNGYQFFLIEQSSSYQPRFYNRAVVARILLIEILPKLATSENIAPVQLVNSQKTTLILNGHIWWQMEVTGGSKNLKD